MSKLCPNCRGTYATGGPYAKHLSNCGGSRMIRNSRGGAKIHAWVRTEYGDRVDVKLYDHRTTRDIYWSPRWEKDGGHGGRGGLNSYVLAEPPGSGRNDVFETPNGRAALVCVNGIGEIRWAVSPSDIALALRADEEDWARPHDAAEMLMAAHHFGIV